MKLFDSRRGNWKAIREAKEYAEKGYQALHIWEPKGLKKGWPNTPKCFRESDFWGHLIDQDEERLIATARKLGVKNIKVCKKGTNEQHIDLCKTPLRKAIGMCKTDIQIMMETPKTY